MCVYSYDRRRYGQQLSIAPKISLEIVRLKLYCSSFCPSDQSSSMPQIRLFLTARKPEANHIASLLDPILEEEGYPCVLFEDEESPGKWCYSVYVDESDVESTDAFIRDRLGSDLFGLKLEQEVLEDQDWVLKTLKDLSPVTAGRFIVHGSHDRHLASTKPVSVEINAGQAFGTGHHGTTAGCLELLEDCLRSRKPQRALDIGTGSGVLAIALAKATRIPILATDIDPVAVQVARENVRLNGTVGQVNCIIATGFQHRRFADFGKADLVLANILAGPLQRMAKPMRPQVQAGGRIILSGLLPHQKARIVASYSHHGFKFQKAIVRDGWLSLLLRLPH